MPSIKRVVDAEITPSEVVDELRAVAAKTPSGVFLLGEDGSKGERVSTGDALVPKPETYDTTEISPGTPVYVADVSPTAGLIWGGFLMKDGQIGWRFFQGAQFESKFQASGKATGRKRKGF